MVDPGAFTVEISVGPDKVSKEITVEEDPRIKRLADEALIKIATRQPPPVTRNPASFPTALDAALATDR